MRDRNGRPDENHPHHIYYNLGMINNDTIGSAPVPLVFNEIRSSPFLQMPQDYYMSVVRFSMQTSTLPVMVPQVMLGQPDETKLIYSITLTYQTFEYQQYVEYIPYDLTQPQPRPPVEFQDLESDYYFVYSYQHWIYMVNQTFISAYNGLKALILADDVNAVLPTIYPPFMEFDPVNLLPILDTDELGYAATLASPIGIYFNKPMHTLFSSFPYIKYGFQVPGGKNFKLDIHNNNGMNVINLANYNALQTYAEYSCAGLWNPINALVFTTSLLPIVPELISVPRIFNSESDLFNTGNNNNIQPVLTDFIVPFSPTNTYKPTIDYTPSGEYRLADLYGTNPLSALQMSVFWKDHFGNLHPFILGSGCSASVKIMFRRKTFNVMSLR